MTASNCILSDCAFITKNDILPNSCEPERNQHTRFGLLRRQILQRTLVLVSFEGPRGACDTDKKESHNPNRKEHDETGHPRNLRSQQRIAKMNKETEMSLIYEICISKGVMQAAKLLQNSRNTAAKAYIVTHVVSLDAELVGLVYVCICI